MATPKNILLAYRFTGEDQDELAVTLGQIKDALEAKGHTVYCSLNDQHIFREAGRSNREIMEHAFRQLDTADLLFAFIKSDSKSEGMLTEIGYAIAKGKPFWIALRTGVKTTSIAELADKVIEFDSVEDLCQKIDQVEL